MRKLFYLTVFCCLSSAFTWAQPIRDWVSYYGGNMTNISGVHYDSVGKCIYTVGITYDTMGIATPNSFKSHLDFFLGINFSTSNSDAYLAKWDLNGQLIWSTYYGGDGAEHSPRIKTDSRGDIYILGHSFSDTGLTTPNAYLSGLANSYYYLTKFSSNGQRLWSTLLTLDDTVLMQGSAQSGYRWVHNVNYWQLAIDDADGIYASFCTAYQKEIGTPGTHKSQRNAMEIITLPNNDIIYDPFDIALVKFDAYGNKLWGSFYGGGLGDYLLDLYYSKDGYIYILGKTDSDTGIATPNTYQDTLEIPINGILQPYFLAKMDTNGQRVWGTYIQLIHDDLTDFTSFSGITGDEEGNIYISGCTDKDSNIATPGVYQEVRKGGRDLFILKFNNAGQKVWGTYIGGEGNDQTYLNVPFANISSTQHHQLNYITGYLYLSGYTSDTTGWDAQCGYQTTFEQRGLIVKMDTAAQFVWASFYENPINDLAVAAQANGKNELYIIGETTLDGITTPNVHQETKATMQAGFVGKMIDDYQCDSLLLTIHSNNDLLHTQGGFDQYFWYHNNNLITTTTDSQLMITDTTGSYYVQASYCQCFYQSDTFTFSTTAIPDFLAPSPYRLYPNPAHQQLTIQGFESGSSAIQIVVLDILGKVVWKESISTQDNAIQLNIAALTPGIHIIKIIEKDVTSWMKFMKE